MGWFDLFLCVTGGIYLGAIAWLGVGLGRHREGRTAKFPRVSVIVPARNEEEQLKGCLRALRGQDYPGDWEVVVIDDRSEDTTGEIVRREADSWEQLKLVTVVGEPRFKCPKKSALARGIEASSGDLLLFTDADCRPQVGWVKSMVGMFAEEVGLVAGYAFPDSGRRVRQKLLALDNLAVGALGAGSLGMGRALSCTGRNLAYRRRVYDEVGGFERIGHLVGGDDVYLARMVATETDWKLVFNRDRGADVFNAPPPVGLGEIINQKLRHAAKGGHYQGPALVLGVAVYLFHFFLFLGLMGMALERSLDLFFLSVWGGRWAADGALLWRMARREERSLLLGLPLLEVCYIPYVLLFTLLGRSGCFRWKS